MRYGTGIIERYLVKAILPYLLLALLLQAVFLLVRETSSLADLLAGVRVPVELAAKVAIALVPNLLSYTLPIAILAGTIIGFSQMSADNELVALRAAGVSTWKMLWPVLLVGGLISVAVLYINLELLPNSNRTLRLARLQAALYKLDSPVEPRLFNAEIPGYLIYVRDGDKAKGRWGRVFIHSQDSDRRARLITARSGRIDSSAEQSELVLSDAVVTSWPQQQAENVVVMERLAQLRVRLPTGRRALLADLQTDEMKFDELGWQTLVKLSSPGSGPEWRRVAVLLHKRLSRSLSPLVFAFFGASLGMRVRREGRGWGALLSLFTFIIYYSISVMGEETARAGTVSPAVGVWLATALMVAFGLFLLVTRHRRTRIMDARTRASEVIFLHTRQRSGSTRWLRFPSLLDVSVLRLLTLHLTFAFASLTAVVLLFTLFESWSAITLTNAGVHLLGPYLFSLLPSLSVRLLPASVLIASLATYALITRRSETIAWFASGQSVYRLVLPGLLFAATVGMLVWLIQEGLMPQANLRQNLLRAQISGAGPHATTPFGRRWLATAGGRFYEYEFEQTSGTLTAPALYEFDAEETHLRRAVIGQKGLWTDSGTLQIRKAELLKFTTAKVEREQLESVEITEADPPAIFKPTTDKPSQLSAERLSAYIRLLEGQHASVVPLKVALQRKYAEPFVALVIAMISISLALSFGRHSAFANLCAAIVMALAYWATTERCQQLGEYGLLPARVAVWSPLIIFATAGIYLLSRART